MRDDDNKLRITTTITNVKRMEKNPQRSKIRSSEEQSAKSGFYEPRKSDKNWKKYQQTYTIQETTRKSL